MGMIAIENTLVSEDILSKKFVCDLGACKGECCVAGVSGAPLDKEEVEIMESILPKVKPYMTKEGLKAVKEQGVYVIDDDRELTTPLIEEGGACAFVYMEKKIAKCAIEKAFLDGKIDFKKPISCHLYPIRIEYKNGIESIEYHRWKVCKPACTNGVKLNVPIFKFLKEPLVRKYGNLWYKKLELVNEQRKK